MNKISVLRSKNPCWLAENFAAQDSNFTLSSHLLCTGHDPVQTGGDQHKQLNQKYTDTDTWHDDFLRFISDAKCYNSVLNIIYQDRIIVFRQTRSTFFRIP